MRGPKELLQRRIATRIGVLLKEGPFSGAPSDERRAHWRANEIRLSIGEPDFPTPPPIVEAAVRALRDGATRYGNPVGLSQLRQAVAETHAGFGLHVQSGHVVVTPGAKAALALGILSLVQPGDPVLVPDPGFPMYASLVRFAGGVAVPYTVQPDAEPLPDDFTLARHAGRVRAIIINSPHNPTGTVASVAGLERVAEYAERNDLAVISDEIYARLLHEPDESGGPVRAPSIAAVPGLAQRTVVIDGFSKAFAMTGWRLGYGIFPFSVASAAELLAVNLYSCVPTFVQHAGLAALESGDDFVAAHRAELRRRRDTAVRALATVAGVRCAVPAGAMYVFPDIRDVLRRTGETSGDFTFRLNISREVMTLPGVAFGRQGEGHLRLALTVPGDRLMEAIARMDSLIHLARAEVLATTGTTAHSTPASSGGAA